MEIISGNLSENCIDDETPSAPKKIPIGDVKHCCTRLNSFSVRCRPIKANRCHQVLGLKADDSALFSSALFEHNFLFRACLLELLDPKLPVSLGLPTKCANIGQCPGGFRIAKKLPPQVCWQNQIDRQFYQRYEEESRDSQKFQVPAKIDCQNSCSTFSCNPSWIHYFKPWETAAALLPIRCVHRSSLGIALAVLLSFLNKSN